MTDHFTRYEQAFQTKYQLAETTAKVLFDNFIVHYGFPSRIHSDQGPNFESEVMKDLCSLTGMEKSHNFPYHPMGNGQIERFNPILLKTFGTLEEYETADWKSHVAPLVHAYNVTIHKSIGYSPYFLTFGRHPKLAIDATLGINNSEEENRSKHEYIQKLRERLELAYSKAKSTVEKGLHQDKVRYDLRPRANKLEIGDLVLLRNVTLRGKQKLADKWEDTPYVVIAQPNPDIPVYKVKKECPRARKTRIVHMNLLLPLGQRKTGKKPAKYVIPARRNQDD